MFKCDKCGKETNFGGARCDNCGAEVCDQCLDDLESKSKFLGRKYWLCPSCGEYKLSE